MTAKSRIARSAIGRYLTASALGFAATGALGLGGWTSPAHAQFTVFDPTNYSQNLLTTARALQQINNQIQSLQNQSTMLLNQAKNLTTINFPEVQAIMQKLQQIDQLMSQAKGIQFRVTTTDQQYQQLFPSTFNPALTSNEQIAAARTRLDASITAFGHALTPPASPNMLSAGSIIAASLITGLRSDLPGLVTAQVTERVYDSATGRILLIPQGARLIGSYDSVVAFGQRRALVVWQRIILPDGSSLAIDNVPAADPSGYAGLADKVDFHTWSLLKGVVLSTLLGVGSSLTFTGESNLVQAIRESTQQNVSRAGDQITSRNLQVQPTISIRPGAPVRLVVHRDLILKPWQE